MMALERVGEDKGNVRRKRQARCPVREREEEHAGSANLLVAVLVVLLTVDKSVP